MEPHSAFSQDAPSIPCDGAPGPGAPREAVVRKIIHVDMDAFFASVEQRDDPALRGRPVAVGGASARGVVAAASYEARAFGVRSAMSSVVARRKCPELVFVKPRFEAYKAVSAQIREIFYEFTDLVEPLSLDEAYLDVTENFAGEPSATRIAQAIRAEIRAKTGLTASAGVSYNKFLAKLASDERKPDGLFVVPPQMGPSFVSGLPVERLHGVGPATRARMNRLGLMTVADLRERPLDFLSRRFGKAGRHYYGLARGIDERPVRPDRPRKSIGAETTFFEDLDDAEAMRAALAPIAQKVWGRAAALGVCGRGVTLKAKSADFVVSTRARSLRAPVASVEALTREGFALLACLPPQRRGVRLLGLSLSALEPVGREAVAQLDLALA